MKLFTREVEDQYAQDNFLALQDWFDTTALVRGEFKFFQFTVPTVTGATVSYPQTLSLPHNLPFTPKDIITLHNLNNATLTWNYTSFTSTNISLTVSAATTIRALIGRYA